MKTTPCPPNLSRLPLSANVLKLLADPCPFILQAHKKGGDIFSFGEIQNQPLYLVAHPDHVQYVLQENQQNFMLGGYLEKDKIIFGKPTHHPDPTSQKWQKQSALSQKRTKSHLPLMVEKTEYWLDSLKESVQPGDSLDLLTLMRKLSLSINGHILFGTNIDDHLDNICPILTNVMRYFTYRNVLGYIGLPPWFPLPGQKEFQIAQEFLERMVELNNETEGDNSNLLSVLKKSTHHANSVQNRLAPLLFASYETTATTLTWFFYALATHPDIEANVTEEIERVVGNVTPTAAQLPRLTYTNQVIHEVFRVFPPIFFIGRVSRQKDVIGGFQIPANSFILISPYLTHRHPDFWEDAETFNPDNFSEQNLAKQHPHAYIPFGSGPHICMGRRYALTELPLVICMVLQNYKIKLDTNLQVKPRPMPTLLPHGGLPVTFYPKIRPGFDENLLEI